MELDIWDKVTITMILLKFAIIEIYRIYRML
jgi:hypothetical protein